MTACPRRSVQNKRSGQIFRRARTFFCPGFSRQQNGLVRAVPRSCRAVLTMREGRVRRRSSAVDGRHRPTRDGQSQFPKLCRHAIRFAHIRRPMWSRPFFGKNKPELDRRSILSLVEHQCKLRWWEGSRKREGAFYCSLNQLACGDCRQQGSEIVGREPSECLYEGTCASR